MGDLQAHLRCLLTFRELDVTPSSIRTRPENNARSDSRSLQRTAQQSRQLWLRENTVRPSHSFSGTSKHDPAVR